MFAVSLKYKILHTFVSIIFFEFYPYFNDKTHPYRLGKTRKINSLIDLRCFGQIL